MKAAQTTDELLATLATTYGTPLYVYDLAELAARVEVVRQGLPAEVALCYATKANTFVLQALEPLVERLEVCSPGEYHICEALGLPHNKLVVSGVYKDEKTVRKALSASEDAAALTVESRAQFELIARVASEFNRTAPVLLRLTSGNQFGLSLDELFDIAHSIAAGEVPSVRMMGVQYFSGTQKHSARRLHRELGKLNEVLARLEEECGFTGLELEFGPGLPVAYFEGDELDEPALLAELSQALAEVTHAQHITLELGRSLVASCGTYLTSVVDTKVNAGMPYAIVDGGIHQIVYFGQSMAMRQPPCHIVGRSQQDEKNEQDAENNQAWNLCGSLCTVNDILAKQLPLPDLACGDVLAFSRAGAYCIAEGMALFLSRDLPRVVLLDKGGETRLVRDAVRTYLLNMAG